MGRRKRIAVITADIANDYMNKICTGIKEQAVSLGYDVFVFLMAFNVDKFEEVQHGEENIYNLISRENIDGIIMLLGNSASPAFMERIGRKVEKLGIPAVTIESPYDFCETIYADDTDLIEMMTDHFIEYHNCRKIICLTGMEGLVPSENRLEGYKKSLIKHGIEVRDDYIIYGDFWKPSAVKLAEDIISGRIEKPDAVVCANDAMGTNLCNALIDGGVKVPEEIKISGYDGSRDAIENIPSLTTVYTENRALGAKSVVRLHKLITGENAELIPIPKGSLILAGSCGCHEGMTYFAHKRASYMNVTDDYEKLFNNSGMAEGLFQGETLEQMLARTTEYLYLLKHLKVFTVALCKEWDNFGESDESSFLSDGYSEFMETKIIYNGVNAWASDREFRSAEIVPDYITDELVKEPAMYFIMPLHFMKRCFGYTIYSFSNIEITLSSLFVRWNRNINTALEFLRVRTKLTAINKRIALTSIRDTLTGIYNRKGFTRFSESLFRKAKTEHRKLLILIADLDMLKHINDNFGHIEGDNAIVVCANGLNTCCKNNEICARTGGDEYAVVGCYDYTDEIINSYVKYINDYFERYNNSSGKGYSVGASLGWFCGIPEEDYDFQHYMDIADKRMYENKFERKKFRRD